MATASTNLPISALKTGSITSTQAEEELALSVA